jgi:hypothetical protein
MGRAFDDLVKTDNTFTKINPLLKMCYINFIGAEDVLI